MKHITLHPKQYTVIPHTIITDKRLSARALGLWVKMTSFPDYWEYSVKSLAAIMPDGTQSIRSGLTELEKLGYLRRIQKHTPDGLFAGYEYEIYDIPNMDHGSTDISTADAPSSASPLTELAPQVSTNETNSKEANNNTLIINQSIINEMRDEIKEQIEYDALIDCHGAKLVGNIVDIMLDVALTDSLYIALSNARSYPVALVQAQYQKLSMEHVDAVLDAFGKVETGVTNLRAYLLTSLFDIVATFDTAVDFAFQRDWGVSAKRTGGRR